MDFVGHGAPRRAAACELIEGQASHPLIHVSRARQTFLFLRSTMLTRFRTRSRGTSMLRTYKAILHGDQVEWLEQPPEKSRPVQVHITVLEEPAVESTRERGRAMAEALVALAQRGT